MSTQRKIAAALNVAPSTVSRALKNDPRIGEQTRRKVLEAARQLNYDAGPQRTVELSQSTPKNDASTRILVAFTSVLTRQFFAESVLGMVHAASERQCIIDVEADVSEHFEPEKIATLVTRSRPDGLILVAFAPISRVDILPLQRTHTPFLLVNRHLHGECNAVTLDDYSAGFEAVRYLYGLGHRRIAHIHGELQRTSVRERLAGFRAGADELGIDCSNMIAGGPWAPGLIEKNRAITAKLLDQPNPPTAIFAYSDHVAAGVLQELDRRSISVPGDIAVLGCDNRLIAADLDLSSFSFRQYDMGVVAGHLLMDLLEGRARPPMRICVYPELIVRGSTESQTSL